VKKKKLHKLPQDVVNQIAAGEVVERPASVVKELVDNAIDAQADKIEVRVKNGGIDMIEVSDNGFGIPKEELPFIFDAHTTSKIEKIEDLNTLVSMGFRGEALSAITSVARVNVASKYIEEEIANEVDFNEKGKSSVKKTAKEKGTTVRVENLFYNIPARKKHLKTPQTEYRKIYELMNNYYLVYPNIHFVLEKDGKTVLDLPAINNSKKGDITEERVGEIMNEEASNFLQVFYEGGGVKISGYVAHPSKHKSVGSKSYMFVNNRPVWDKGIYRAVHEGFSRYIPHGQKIDFVIKIDMNPEFVDVNVHPRKEEVRFENPYRIYSAIEDAIRHTLEKELSFRDFSSLRERFNKTSTQPPKREGVKEEKGRVYESRNIYTSGRSTSVKDSLLFSKEILSSQAEEGEDQQKDLPWEEEMNIRNIFQIFNKYIVIEFTDERLWVIDQHAAAERINFEKLSKGKNGLDLQNYLVPVEIKLAKEEAIFLDEVRDFFEDIGIIYEINNNKLILKTVPTALSKSNFKEMFNEIFSLEDNINDLKKNLEKRRDDLLATVSCHASIRSGQKLTGEEMLNLFRELSTCVNPYSCPHGRPAVWRLALSEIDTNFERTY
jgi:DNA mismatch repair protein MutL